MLNKDALDSDLYSDWDCCLIVSRSLRDFTAFPALTIWLVPSHIEFPHKVATEPESFPWCSREPAPHLLRNCFFRPHLRVRKGLLKIPNIWPLLSHDTSNESYIICASTVQPRFASKIPKSDWARNWCNKSGTRGWIPHPSPQICWMKCHQDWNFEVIEAETLVCTD